MLTDYAAVAYAYTFDPFSTAVLNPGCTGGNGVKENPFPFKGGIQDRATGWVHYGNRWYNTTLGRWTQQDTLDVPLDPVNANRYAYAGSDPINNFDPLGLYDLEAAAGTVGTFAGGAGAVGATVGCVVGLIGSGPACVAGAGAGAAISGAAGGAFGIGVAIGNSIKGVYG
ncbi:RHS repeat-associated core domain-containing protein [Microbacterium sp. LWO14-1.2]|uniref:RHS repeat-associated core domain-containing protein n=1 Tax=Microbacterium sp. LWO14-1.2 TaxID=3135263 RepID=UPI003139B80D